MEDIEEDITDEEFLRNVEHLEKTAQQEGGGAATSNREGYFKFKLTPFKEKKAKSYGIKRNSYHLKLQNPQDTFPVGHGNIIRAFEEGLANSIKELIRGLANHDRIQIYLGSNRLRNAHTSASVSVEQWRDPLGASRQVLHNISNLLNSNENFEKCNWMSRISPCRHLEVDRSRGNANDAVSDPIITGNYSGPNDPMDFAMPGPM